MIVEHPSGFTIEAPDDWQVFPDPSEEIAVIMSAPPASSGFASNLTITTGAVGPERGNMGELHSETFDALRSLLRDAQLIDIDFDEERFRRIISYATDDHALTLEQWVWKWQRQDRVDLVTVSFTATTLDYAIMASLADAIAATWQPQQGEIR